MQSARTDATDIKRRLVVDRHGDDTFGQLFFLFLNRIQVLYARVYLHGQKRMQRGRLITVSSFVRKRFVKIYVVERELVMSERRFIRFDKRFY